MTVIWTREALEKLNEIEEFINYLIEHAESIAQNPNIGRTVPEILNPQIREVIVKKYRIVYRIKEEKIVILTVFEGHRLLRIDELKID